MRPKLVSLCAVLLAMCAATAFAENAEKPKNGKEGKERPHPVGGVVTAVNVGEQTVSWTIKTKDGQEKTVAMASSVNVLMHTAGDKTVVMGLFDPSAKTPKPKNDKMKVVAGTITAASVSDEMVKLTIKTGEDQIEAQIAGHVSAMTDKDGQVVMLKAGGGHEKAAGKNGDKGKEKKENKEKKEKKQKKEKAGDE